MVNFNTPFINWVTRNFQYETETETETFMILLTGLLFVEESESLVRTIRSLISISDDSEGEGKNGCPDRSQVESTAGAVSTRSQSLTTVTVNLERVRHRAVVTFT